MAAPPKPWESAGANYRIASNFPNPPGFSRAPVSSTSIPSNLPTRNVQQQPPPVPSRTYRQSTYAPMTSSTYPSYGSYGGYSGLSGYGSYGGYGGYGGYSGYGGYGGGYGYGGYGVGMNRYGGYLQRPELESRFIRVAEESTRPAFQSIESLVQAFSSVTFMLESTFGAIHNSFRAVLSVAENMGRLRSVFSQLFSAFTIFRTLQWLYKKCLYLLGVLKCDPSQDDIWLQAASRAEEQQEAAAGQSRFSWPVLVLMGIMLSGPYLMWKLLSTLNESVGSGFSLAEWKKSKQPVTLAVAEYDFKAANEEELSVCAGDRVLVAPMNFQAPNAQQSGWVLATVDGQKAGFVPLNYLRITGKMHYNRAVPVKVPPQKQQNAMAAEFPETPETPEMAWQPATDITSVHTDAASVHTLVNEGTTSLSNRTELEMPMPLPPKQIQDEPQLLQQQQQQDQQQQQQQSPINHS
ncbi:probable peroxisomal membrane protein PEX13 isoform X1 [Schistocerca americana]|uniref:probable peroxisomal membrane protein PEX13 isoform X1 n=1 Tax=Schistocerca americana TaxID=7009 RepID=UPI001F500170|nr:probable peroxisomal membrane protein PEX13 isoform X1 [Schistocerca americana]